MTPLAVTTGLLHDLIGRAHAEGVTAIDVAASIDHDGRVLLVVEPGRDFIDHTWQLPAGPVLPGETLTDALPKALAGIGLDLAEVTGYLGHHDRIDEHVTRVFCFAVTVTDPDSICRCARIGHRWADLEDLPDLPAPPGWPHPAILAAALPPAGLRDPHDAPLAAALRAGARGLCAVQAGTELLIGHAAWLHRSDFRDRFVHPHTAITADADTADIDWPAAITTLDTGDLPCSASEDRMLRLAASLAQGIPVNLRHALVGLDDRNLDLVSQAILHAAGRRQQRCLH